MEDTVVDGAIIGESSDLNILRSHKGFAWIDIGTRGLAAHGSSWETGVDAITKMGKVLKGLQDIGERLSVKRHPLVGPASVHASTIKGGLELSTYPDSCLLQVERRTIPGEKKEDVRKEIEDLLNTIAKDDKEFKAFYDITFYRDPMDVPENCELLQTLFNASMDAIDYKPLFIGGSGWLDTQIIWEKGIPVVSYGPTGEGDHSAVEWVSIDSMIKAAKVQELTIRRYCGENL
jgi:acetylornithine deacetylase